MSPPAIPDRWIPYKPFGSVIEGTRLICFKVPLRKRVQEDCIKQGNEIWDIETLLTRIPNLGIVIDLTNTARYYDPREFEAAGVQHVKLGLPGRTIPSEKTVKEFCDTVERFLRNNADLLVGVHCTHGLNRTGYMVCRYLRDRLGMPAEKAIESFQQARGYEMVRQNLVRAILQRNSVKKVEKVHISNWPAKPEVPATQFEKLNMSCDAGPHHNNSTSKYCNEAGASASKETIPKGYFDPGPRTTPAHIARSFTKGSISNAKVVSEHIRQDKDKANIDKLINPFQKYTTEPQATHGVQELDKKIEEPETHFKIADAASMEIDERLNNSTSKYGNGPGTPKDTIPKGYFNPGPRTTPAHIAGAFTKGSFRNAKVASKDICQNKVKANESIDKLINPFQKYTTGPQATHSLQERDKKIADPETHFKIANAASTLEYNIAATSHKTSLSEPFNTAHSKDGTRAVYPVDLRLNQNTKDTKATNRIDQVRNVARTSLRETDDHNGMHLKSYAKKSSRLGATFSTSPLKLSTNENWRRRDN